MYPRPYGNYVLLERIGTGGMSEVDLARKGEDPDLVRFLVIKRIKADKVDDDAFVRMFKDEARITSELHHANIAQVYDFGRVGDEYYLALEYVPGLDVRRIINTLRKRHQRVPLKIVFRILMDVLEGLHYAHTKVDTLGNPMRIVHRDVNPRNVMVSVRGDVKLIDFGVARATNRLERTKTDHVKGKFAYMAPEQVDGSNKVDGRVDIFAAGLTFHELLAGYGPFSGMTQIQIVHRLVSGTIPNLPVPEEYPDPERLLAIHAKALAPKAQDRYATAREFARALEAAAALVGGPATTEEVVSFVARVDPTLQKEVRSKLHSYSGPVDLRRLRAESADNEASMSGVSTGTFAQPVTITRGGVVAAGGLLGAGLISIVLVLGLAIAVVLTQGSGREATSPSVGEALESDRAERTAVPKLDDPEPLEAPQDREPLRLGVVDPSSPGLEVTSDKDVAPSVAPRTAPAAPTTTAAPAVPAPEPVVPVEASSEPPVPSAEPVEAPVPEMDSSAATPPAPVPAAPKPIVMGLLQVTATESGRVIFINGEPTPHVTPSRFEWEVGSHEIAVEGYDGSKPVDVRQGQSRALVFR